MFSPAFVVLLCQYFIVFLAFYWSNKSAAVLQLLREYHWVIYSAYQWGNNDPIIIGDEVLHKYL